MRRIICVLVLFLSSAVLYSQTLFFNSGSEWKYLDNGSNQGENWRLLSFDDSTWLIGDGHFGFGDGDENTLLQSGHICYYFRKKVVIEDVSELSDIRFHIVHDDGMVLYINGVEVVRSPLMPQSGEINYLTPTTTYIPTSSENNFWEYQVPSSFFVNGENIIAISVHNQSVSSSDLSFDCYVRSGVEYKTDGPYVFYRNNEIVVKQILQTGVNVESYSLQDSVVLECHLPSDFGSFSFGLRRNFQTELSEYEKPSKFLALSDIEGEIEAFVMLLRNSGVMNENYEWTYGDGALIFVGDMFDRGEYVTECLWLLYKLENEAKQQGGMVRFILGNHDVMNLIGDFRYVNQKYIDNVVLMNESLMSIYAGNTELGRWLRSKNAIEKAGDYLFVHAGISPAVRNLSLSLDSINYWVRYRLDNNCTTNSCNVVNGGTTVGGVYWYRGMAREELSQNEINWILDFYGVSKVFLGHTVFPQITSLYENRVVAIDVKHETNFLNGFMEACKYQNSCLYRYVTSAQNDSYSLIMPCSETKIEESILKKVDCEIGIFPNPVSDKFELKIEKCDFLFSSSVKLRLYDSKNRLVKMYDSEFQESILAVEVVGLKAGVYFLQIDFFDFSYFKKLIISQ